MGIHKACVETYSRVPAKKNKREGAHDQLTRVLSYYYVVGIRKFITVRVMLPTPRSADTTRVDYSSDPVTKVFSL